ncbi:MAG: asparaginase [Oscillospiraceae bacterium]|nr:asparaginase [Oscillospiraceae bacterium]MBQ9109484.1 asparaginase [Oscillospiraceae bacterium]
MKKILLLATGGTIACRPNEQGGLAPAITPRELLDFVPELAEICQIETLQLYNLDSTNVGPEHWVGMTQAVRENYEKYDGFVITHGTDTMAYTASALSYMIQNTSKPIVLTGSQKSIYNRDTDARNNLLRAFSYAGADGAWGVQIVFDNKVILGTRARKVRSKSFDAFSSIDYPETAVFRDSRLIFFMPKPTDLPPVQFYTKLDPAVFVLRLVPGIRAEIFQFLKPMFRAIVIEGFGVGGLPDSHDSAMLKAVTDWTASGRIAVFSTQVQHEGSDLGIYEVGRLAKELPGVLEAHDMTPEASVTKLMWVLGQTDDRALAQKMFTTPIQHDLL